MAGGQNADAAFGTIYSYVAGYADNGNILTHSDSVMGTWNFTYDAVDRLSTATQTAVSATSPASQNYAGKYGCWSYDAFGNRTMEAFSTASCDNNPTPQVSASYNQANNRITSTGLAAFNYDAAGNTINDGWNRYWYDAEGQLCAVQSIRYGNGPVIQYVYDAEGARIAKGTLTSAPGSYYATCAPPLGSGFTLTNRYLVDLNGAQVTELNGSGTWQHSNIWAGGKLVATYDTKGIHLELTDPLGTKRLQVNALGQVDETCTSLPFGNDLNNPTGANCALTTNSLGTSDDATEHHFTSRERDTETGNDYLLARYYTSALGRFTTPDWSAKVEPVPYAVFDDPQSLNLYAYVRNDPIVHADLDGHACNSLDWGCNPWSFNSALSESTRAAQRGTNPHKKELPNFTELTLNLQNTASILHPAPRD
jgi:RHS repeat-associated protein